MSLKFDTGRQAKHAVMLGAGSRAAAAADLATCPTPVVASSPGDTCSILLLRFHVCDVYCTHPQDSMCVHECGYTRLSLCKCIWRPEVDVSNHPQLLFYLLHRSRFCQLTEFTELVSLTSQLALGVPSLKLQVDRHTHPAFTWVSSSAQARAVSTLTMDPSP